MLEQSRFSAGRPDTPHPENYARVSELTARGLSEINEPYRMDDMVFVSQLPEPAILKRIGKEIVRQIRAGQVTIPEEILIRIGFRNPQFKSPDRLAYDLAREYSNACSEDLRRQIEPAWIAGLNPESLRFFRTNHELGEGSDNPLAIVPKLPFTGIGYLIENREFTRNVVDTFNLFRLARIRKLGLLHTAVVKEAERPRVASQVFDHTCYLHSLDVHAIASLLGIRSRLTPEQMAILRVAALSHDALTPAGGDTVKMIDRYLFDEDRHYPELLVGPKWEQLRRKLSISADDLAQVVQSRGGALSGLLDLADKSAYVARDAEALLNRRWSGSDTTDVAQIRNAVERLLMRNPLAAGIWDSVELSDQRVVFTDPKRLQDFLTLRALLFRGLYYHAGARFLEGIVGQVIARYLYETGQLSRADLLSMDDSGLEQRVDQVVGRSFFVTMFGAADEARVESFDSLAAATAREEELIREGRPVTFVDEFKGVTKPGTHFWVQDKGNIKPFTEASPRAAQHIQRLINIDHPVRLYSTIEPPGGEPMSSEFQKAIAAYRQRRGLLE
ncbi:MAG: hypothetical protein HY978_00710 [Candidatus Liptonbacteria bacterium]|nr:hypothetical protein [Candidatus Liptonbacteria bacterium]